MVDFALSHHGYKVLAAATGMEALQILEKDNVDCILTDMKMSPMDGLDTVIAIKKMNSEIPIILMTGYAVEERIQKALEMKATTCMKKPFSTEELHNLVDALTECKT